MPPLLIPVVALFVCGWAIAALSAAQLVLFHRAEDKSIAYYAVRGAIFFNSDNWAPTGGAAHRRMLIGFAIAIVGFLGLGVGIAMSEAMG